MAATFMNHMWDKETQYISSTDFAIVLPLLQTWALASVPGRPGLLAVSFEEHDGSYDRHRQTKDGSLCHGPGQPLVDVSQDKAFQVCLEPVGSFSRHL